MVGHRHGDCYFPSFSGVGRSLNYYPIGDEKATDGVAQVAIGLGKYIVDGGQALRFCPRHPRKVLQTSTLDFALRDTQTYLDALNIDEKASGNFSVNDGFNLVRRNVQDFASDRVLDYMVSRYDYANDMLIDNNIGPGRRVVTFANVLRDNVFPLAPAVDFMLRTGQEAMGRPVEVEFAGDINLRPGQKSPNKGHIYWLQIRPIIDRKDMVEDSMLKAPEQDLLLRSNTALGHGNIDDITTVVYVRSQSFSPLATPAIAADLQKVNSRLVAEGRNYILIGPGRWGSSDTSLGIPVRWPDISGARLIVETALGNYRIEPSQGTHFFQNLTSFGVGYFTVNPFTGDGSFFDSAWLDAFPAEFENEYIRVVRFSSPLLIGIDGRKSVGVVLKPGAAINTTENQNTLT